MAKRGAVKSFGRIAEGIGLLVANIGLFAVASVGILFTGITLPCVLAGGFA